MTDQQILEKAIQKAQRNGWLEGWDVNYTDSLGWTQVAKGSVKKSKVGLTAKVTYMISENDIIFDPAFAKALWKPKLLKVRATYSVPKMDGEIAQENCLLSIWQYHLMRMVVADDPIKYLGENI